MKTFSFHSAILLFAACCFGFTTNTMQTKSIIVIVNKNNPVATLTAGEVKLYYLRKLKKRWPEINKNIKPVDRKEKCSEQNIFYSKVLKMNSLDVETYFVEKQYQSIETPPDRFETEKEVLDYVSKEAGAIGYINMQSLSPETKEKVKIICTINE